jgi:hypothetical protein
MSVAAGVGADVAVTNVLCPVGLAVTEMKWWFDKYHQSYTVEDGSQEKEGSTSGWIWSLSGKKVPGGVFIFQGCSAT